jgi:hypothetical protein
MALKAMKKSDRQSYDLDLVIAEQKALKKTKGSEWFLSLEASFHDTANYYFLMVRSHFSVLLPSARLLAY